MRIFTAPIPETECIGNSLITINNNYSNLDTQAQTLTADLIRVRNDLLTSQTMGSATYYSLTAVQNKTTTLELSVLQAGYVPLFCIIMYAKQSITVPDFDANGKGIGSYNKFALCDGRSHITSSGLITTPDLRDKFILGGVPLNAGGVNFTAGTNIGATLGFSAGSKDHILTLNELPSHTHTATFAGSALPPHTHNYLGPSGDSAMAGLQTGSTTNSEFEGPASLTATSIEISPIIPSGTITVSPTGGNAAHSNMPPFYTLAYIMRIE